MTPKQESQLLKVLIELLSETKKQNERLARIEQHLAPVPAASRRDFPGSVQLARG